MVEAHEGYPVPEGGNAPQGTDGDGSHPVTGIVLAGGRSLRMGTDKALLQVDGHSLLDRVVETVGMVTHDVLVVGRDVPGAVPDDIPGIGPIGGLLTGLRRARTARILVVACDHPHLAPRVLQYLIDLDPMAEAVVPRDAAGPQPLHAVYRTSILSTVEAQVAAGDYRLRSLLAHLDVRWVEEGALRPFDPDLASLRNVNTPDEWEASQGHATE